MLFTPLLLLKTPQIPPLNVRQKCGRISLTTYLTTTANNSNFISGLSEVWYRAWFGTKRPWVRIPQPGPWTPLSHRLRGVQWYPFPGGTGDIPYGYDICYADDIRLRVWRERILYHICSANISYGFSRISYRFGDMSFQCYGFDYVYPIFGYHYKLVKSVMNTRTRKSSMRCIGGFSTK